MGRASDRLYRKTALGLAALGTRSGTLAPRARTALILVNGRDSLATLAGKLGPEAAGLVETLLGLGLVEEVLPVPPAAPAEPMPPAAPPAAPASARLATLKRAALARLAPQFGPDVELVCGPLLAAATDAAYASALAAIESKLSIYLGRRGASELLAGLRPGDDPP